MRTIKRIIFSGMLVVFLMACTGGTRYIVLDDVVVYSYWTFSFGTRTDTLLGADPATFQAVNRWLGHDSKHVYFKDRLVPGADGNSLEPQRYPLFRDKKDYYYQTKALHVADMATFKTIKWIEDDFWATDSRYAYFDTVRIDDVDLPSFKMMSSFMAKDKNHVYYFGEKIPDADAATFERINNSSYYRDKSHIWCGDDLLHDADYETFTVDSYMAAHDKFGSFNCEKRDSVSDKETDE